MFLLTAATSLILVFSQWRAAAGATHPATVSQAASSIALQLHYPPKERAAQKQGAVKFYCEVSPEGKAAYHHPLREGRGTV